MEDVSGLPLDSHPVRILGSRRAHPGSRYYLARLGPWFTSREGAPRPASWETNHSLFFCDKEAVYG